MKNNSSRLFRCIIVLALFACACTASRTTQTVATASDISRAIDGGSWTFTPIQIRPQYGHTRTPNGTYTSTFSPGQLVVYLPYFGRANGGADVFSGKGPLDFTSTDFKTDRQQTKTGEWTIIIKPNDNREVQTMTFSLQDNGSGTLDIIMTNRSAISYSGTINPVPAK